jgi:hypothetical protein
MPSSGVGRSEALANTDVPEECIGSIIRVTRIGELGTLPVNETSVLTRSTWRHIPEDGILHSHPRENLKSYMTCMKYN